jgi:hypothetical protein
MADVPLDRCVLMGYNMLHDHALWQCRTATSESLGRGLHRYLMLTISWFKIGYQGCTLPYRFAVDVPVELPLPKEVS